MPRAPVQVLCNSRCLRLSQWLLQPSKTFLKTNWIFIQYPIKDWVHLMQDFEAGLLHLGSMEKWHLFSTHFWLKCNMFFHHEYRQQISGVSPGPGLSLIKFINVFLSPKSYYIFQIFWNIYIQDYFEITIFIKPSTRLIVKSVIKEVYLSQCPQIILTYGWPCFNIIVFLWNPICLLCIQKLYTEQRS